MENHYLQVENIRSSGNEHIFYRSIKPSPDKLRKNTCGSKRGKEMKKNAQFRRRESPSLLQIWLTYRTNRHFVSYVGEKITHFLVFHCFDDNQNLLHSLSFFCQKLHCKSTPS